MRATASAQLGIAGDLQGAAVQVGHDLELRYVDRQFRAPSAGEVRIRVEWIGLSEFDLAVVGAGRKVGQLPAIPGREVFGRVDVVGPGVDLPAGLAVVVDPRFPCHGCAACVVDPDLCLHPAGLGEQSPGGFATHCLVPAANLVPAGDVDGSLAVMAEPFARALHGIGLLARPPRRVALLGYGSLGVLLHVGLGITFPEAEVVVAELSPARLALARGLGGTVGEMTLPDGSFDAVFDTDGDRGSMNRALELCDDRGQVVTLAESGDEAGIDPVLLRERELSIRGSRGFSKELPGALRMIADHPQMLRPIVGAAIDLSQLPDWIRHEVEAPLGTKVVIRP